MKTTLFPKSLAGLSVGELAEFVAQVGLDGCNAVIRDGFWTPADQLADTLPNFIKQMNAQNLAVPMVETAWNPQQIAALPSLADTLAVIRDSGISTIRLTQLFSGGVFGGVGDVQQELRAARDLFRKIETIAAQNQVRFIYQVHFNTLLASASSLLPMLEGINPAYMAGMLDGGNQVIEGMENWRIACQMLGERLASFGIKDARYLQHEPAPDDPSKGWTFEMVPCTEGMVNWNEVGQGLKEANFDGDLVFMPFYKGYQDDPERLKTILRAEMDYLRPRLGF